MNELPNRWRRLAVLYTFWVMAGCQPALPAEPQLPTTQETPSAPAPESPPPAPIAVEAKEWSGTDLQTADLYLGKLVEAGADVNHRPIRLWFVEPAPGRVEALYVVGHADGACCPLVSRILEDVANDPAFPDGWFSYGVGWFLAHGDSARQGKLASARKALGDLLSQSECSAQVVSSTLPSDEIQAGTARIIAQGKVAFDRAQKLGRPIMLWQDVGDTPRFMPLTIGASDKPVTIKLDADRLGIPAELKSAVSMDGVARYVAQLRTRLTRLEKYSKAQAAAKAIGPQDWTVLRRVGVTYDGGAITEVRTKISSASAKLDIAIRRESFEQQVSGLLGQADAAGLRNLAVLREARGVNDRALASLAGVSGYSTDNHLTYREVELAPSPNPFPQLVALDIKTSRANVEAQLKEAETRALVPRKNGVPLLVDALLRGWPATFGDAKNEQLFDKWAADHQRDVWKAIATQLEGANVRLGGGDAFLRSNMIFKVTLGADGRELTIQPLLIVQGKSFQVADLGAGVVRYETATAEQNLASMEE